MSSQSFVAETHEVLNQVSPLDKYNLYETDPALQDSIELYGGGWAKKDLSRYGQLTGDELFQAGFLANEHLPKFHSHDRYGHRIDQVDFHPAYHQLMKSAVEHGIPSRPWTEPKAGAQVARAGLMYLHNQAEAGTSCPLTMTFASVPALKHQPDVAEIWLPKITARHYDPDNKPWFEKKGVTIGMAMTEKQGGTDVRANTTRATAVGKGGPGQAYELVGHKWFCSAPMCDAFLTLAHTEKGLSCFLLPRWRPDGNKNQFYVQRLKDKMGNKANASSEVEFRGAFAWMIGDAGRGVPTIIEMVSMTRFDCMIGSSSLIRQGIAQAVHHCSQREVMGRRLIDQPLMQNVLADMALESEAALAMTMRVGRALDNQSDEHEALFARITTAIGKYWICKRAPALINEAQECLGGAGYVEDFILPRLYREAPVNSIWEGSGNVQCLDVLRAMEKTPAVLDAFLSEVRLAKGLDSRLDNKVATLVKSFHNLDDFQYRARYLVEQLALCLQASLLLRSDNQLVAEAFCQSRLSGESGLVYGTLPSGIDVASLVSRANPSAESAIYTG